MNITFSIDENILKKARLKANSDNTTLNSLIQIWITNYANTQYAKELEDFFKTNTSYTDRSYTREEMNER